MHQIFFWLEKIGKALVFNIAELREVGDFGQFALIAHPAQHIIKRRFRPEPVLIHIPKFGERRVKEDKPLVPAINRNRGSKVFQNLGMGTNMTRQVGLQFLDRGAINRKADQTIKVFGRLRRTFGNAKKLPVTLDHDMIIACHGFAVAQCRRRQ